MLSLFSNSYFLLFIIVTVCGYIFIVIVGAVIYPFVRLNGFLLCDSPFHAVATSESFGE